MLSGWQKHPPTSAKHPPTSRYSAGWWVLLVRKHRKAPTGSPSDRVNFTDKLRQTVFEFPINFMIQNDFHDFLSDVDAPAGCWLQAAGWMPAAGCCLLAAARPLGRSAAQPLSRSAAQPLSLVWYFSECFVQGSAAVLRTLIYIYIERERERERERNLIV